MAAAFHLLWITPAGWDSQANEPVEGGQILDTADSAAECCELVRAYRLLAERLYGPGILVVTDTLHQCVDPFAELAFERAARAAGRRVGIG